MRPRLPVLFSDALEPKYHLSIAGRRGRLRSQDQRSCYFLSGLLKVKINNTKKAHAIEIAWAYPNCLINLGVMVSFCRRALAARGFVVVAFGPSGRWLSP